MKILRIGHAIYVLKSNDGKNYLIDLFIDTNHSSPPHLDDPDFYQSIDCVS
ncbi:hypothetical protein ACFQ3N_03070 [Virgibacillus byunsanensis]|uniref:Uncharacterized protein n=1 Tax=Virgibacillus byunsanensis TaxID=570945 RepID=A0ABW3LHA0_9BACI